MEAEKKYIQLENTPTVSIGMPVYNGERFIREALDSILEQTFTDFELIISDNASTDGTDAICCDYATRDSRIRYLRQNENKGALFNFEFVLNEARGSFFKWAAVDDLFGTKETLSNLVKSLGSQFQLAVPDVTLVDESKGTITKGLLSSLFYADKMNNIQSIALEYPSFQIYGLFVTNALRQYFTILERNSDLSCFGEGIFVHVVSKEMKCVFVEAATIVYRRHAENISSTLMPPTLLKNFIIYTYRVFTLYIGSSFSLGDKIYFLSKLSLKHAKYILFLVAGSSVYYFRNVFKYLKGHERLA
jgi:glycosyltransferase involved in cell wall biosynthesis